MTVIAWDGAMLAADRRAVAGQTAIFERTKISIVSGCLVGTAGESDSGAEITAWFAAGADPSKFPERQRGEHWAGLLVIQPDKSIWKFEQTPYPVVFPPQRFAIGSGRDYAIAAMHCGRTAREAVEVACAYDPGCGNGVDVLTLPGVPRPGQWQWS